MPEQLVNNNVQGNPYSIRDPRNSSFVEIWLVSAVVTVLMIRLYLYLTGYPQVGGGTLHIAHMLWGGLALIIAFGMLLLFADSVWKPVAALLGGIGFGTFIDELGKFITKDNDYFYQPTIALIYAVFIALYFLARYFDRRREPTEADHLYLAAQGISWQAIGKLDHRRQEEALWHLNASGNTSTLADEIRGVLERADVVEYSEQSRIMVSREKISTLYWRMVKQRWLFRAVIGVFVIRVLEVVIAVIYGIAAGDYDVVKGLGFVDWLSFVAGAATGVLAVYGLVLMLRRQRERALQAFANSTLIALLFGQFFAFASEQMLALGGLVVNLVILGVLRLALAMEREHHSDINPQSVAESPIS